MASEWYVERDGEVVGPVSSAQLKRLADEGKIKPADRVRKDGGTWVVASAVKGLFPTPPNPVAPTPSKAATATTAPRPPAPTAPPPSEPVPEASSRPKGLGDLFGRLNDAVKDTVAKAQRAAESASSSPATPKLNLTPQQKRNLLLVGGACLVLMVVGVVILGVTLPHVDVAGQKGKGGRSTDGVVIEGETAKVEMVIHNGAPFIDNLKTTAFNVGNRVYDVAEEHPTVKKIEIRLRMSKQGVSDKYGKDWTEDRDMGTLTVPDADEVRKYASSGLYASNRGCPGRLHGEDRGNGLRLPSHEVDTRWQRRETSSRTARQHFRLGSSGCGPGNPWDNPGDCCSPPPRGAGVLAVRAGAGLIWPFLLHGRSRVVPAPNRGRRPLLLLSGKERAFYGRCLAVAVSSVAPHVVFTDARTLLRYSS